MRCLVALRDQTDARSDQCHPVRVTQTTVHQSLIETLEVLADDEAMEDLRKSDEDVKAGRVYDWGQVKRDLRVG